MVTYGYDELEVLAATAGFPVGAIPTAAAIALAESGGKDDEVHTNTNGTKDYGLWQINSVHTAILKGGHWENGQDNAKMALKVYKAAGNKFTPWASYNSNAYKAHLGGDASGSAGAGAGAGAGGSGTTKKKGGLGLDDFIDPFGVLPDNPVNSFKDLAQATGHLLSNLLDPDFWKRVGFGVLGVLILVLGFIFIVEQNPKVKSATKLAEKVAVL